MVDSLFLNMEKLIASVYVSFFMRFLDFHNIYTFLTISLSKDHVDVSE